MCRNLVYIYVDLGVGRKVKGDRGLVEFFLGYFCCDCYWVYGWIYWWGVGCFQVGNVFNCCVFLSEGRKCYYFVLDFFVVDYLVVDKFFV